jgi:hypothetical protein
MSWAFVGSRWYVRWLNLQDLTENVFKAMVTIKEAPRDDILSPELITVEVTGTLRFKREKWKKQ